MWSQQLITSHHQVFSRDQANWEVLRRKKTGRKLGSNLLNKESTMINARPLTSPNNKRFKIFPLLCFTYRWHRNNLKFSCWEVKEMLDQATYHDWPHFFPTKLCPVEKNLKCRGDQTQVSNECGLEGDALSVLLLHLGRLVNWKNLRWLESLSSDWPWWQQAILRHITLHLRGSPLSISSLDYWLGSLV